jgi:hypothetical protein
LGHGLSVLRKASLAAVVTLLIGMAFAWAGATKAEAAHAGHHDCPHAQAAAASHHSSHVPAGHAPAQCCVSSLCTPAAIANGTPLVSFSQPLRHARPAASLANALTITGPPAEPPRT